MHQITMNRYLLVVVLTVISYSSLIAAISTYENNDEIRKMIQEAGCAFASTKQLLTRDICLLQNYEANKMPASPNGIVSVNITLVSVIIMEVDEKKNGLTMRISQFIEWFEPRIKLRKSVNDIVWLSSEKANDIWHPDLDMYTKNLEEWKSLHDPYLYEKLMIIPNPLKDSAAHPKDMANPIEQTTQDPYNLNVDEERIKLGAIKSWKVNLRCVFDFSSYPFDIQSCEFFQFGNDGLLFSLQHNGNLLDWKHKIDGFNVEIENVGNVGNDSISFNVLLERIFEPYFYQFYLPCIIIVIVSLISFIIPLSAVPGRIALVATQFLTLTNIFMHQIVSKIITLFIVLYLAMIKSSQFYGKINFLCFHFVLQSDSPGATFSVLDAYILMSLFFVMGTAIELSMILLIVRLKKRKLVPKSIQKTSSKIIDTTNKIDLAAFFIFLSLYIVFNCFYFLKHLKF